MECWILLFRLPTFLDDTPSECRWYQFSPCESLTLKYTSPLSVVCVSGVVYILHTRGQNPCLHAFSLEVCSWHRLALPALDNRCHICYNSGLLCLDSKGPESIPVLGLYMMWESHLLVFKLPRTRVSTSDRNSDTDHYRAVPIGVRLIRDVRDLDEAGGHPCRVLGRVGNSLAVSGPASSIQGSRSVALSPCGGFGGLWLGSLSAHVRAMNRQKHRPMFGSDDELSYDSDRDEYSEENQLLHTDPYWHV
ncbi:hypothetical protein KIPB_009664 [Kipferlia bialata]|uniref:Uncharacterized protein n=1 Tax=Kipferlia bialata TaxID=797122 RepID=A0A391NY57_9EUKA|nr:hypothetical protein KIPB_009664 [Kipferlia bialata]|eukprot:g9664.t1